MAVIIDGKALAAKICAEVAAEAAKLPRKPKLAAVLVGNDPASQIYVRNKERDCVKCGIDSVRCDLPEETKRRFERLLADSVRYAMRNPSVSREFVRSHAQELDDEVIDKHIGLFVNDYTVSLGDEGRQAVERLTGCPLKTP